jgi:hypothetical protein
MIELNIYCYPFFTINLLFIHLVNFHPHQEVLVKPILKKYHYSLIFSLQVQLDIRLTASKKTFKWSNKYLNVFYKSY